MSIAVPLPDEPSGEDGAESDRRTGEPDEAGEEEALLPDGFEPV